MENSNKQIKKTSGPQKPNPKKFLCTQSFNVSIPQNGDFIQKGLYYFLKKDANGNVFIYTLKNNKLNVNIEINNLKDHFKFK